MQTPQATPKQMTDEELRQQYGIQLASRPTDTGDGKEAKWADIDDDEDDWAPETIEWNDGTKINLAQVDSSTPTTTGQFGTTAKPEEVKHPESSERNSTAPKTTSAGPKPTVLKLGTSAQPRSPIEPALSASKAPTSTNEKPTLVAKPSPAPPPRNPWAPLPPVDKFSPVAPPAQQSIHPKFGRDPTLFEGMPPPQYPPSHPLPPTKEIAADDFSRFPRDGLNGMPRELFNSQSGRYEPVPDNRRTPKKDQGFRTPSVLQRPSQTDILSPAEPSPAFQTNRSQQDATQWRRRRASSNVSGENGAFIRRMSSSKGPVDALQRRDSQLEQPLTPSVLSARPSQRDLSPAISHEQSVTSQSPVFSSAQAISPENPGVPQPGTPVTPFGHTQEEVKMQKSLMKEKAEAAHKRRIEEEQRQEAEKRERLRVKMEKLGLTGEKVNRKIEDEAMHPLQAKATLKDANDAKDPPQSELLALQAPVKSISPPKPPVPTANGEPQQYGLMKVHAPQVVAPTVEKKLTNPSDSIRDQKQEFKPVSIATDEQLIPQVNGDHFSKKSTASMGQLLDNGKSADQFSQQLTPGVQPSTSTTGYPAWAQHSMATHSAPGGNVWAAPVNHKGLGNGDFQKRIQVAPAQQQPYGPPQHLVSPQPQPPPIGTPRQTQHKKPTNSEPPIVSLPRHTADANPQRNSFVPDSNVLSSNHLRPHLTHVSPSLDQDLNSAPPLNVMTQTHEAPKTGGLAIWNDFSHNASLYDAKAREKIAQDQAALAAEQQTGGGKSLQVGPVYNETWNKVVKGESLGKRQLVGSVKTQRDYLPTETASLPVRSRYQDIFDHQTDRSSRNQPSSLGFNSLTPPPPPEIEFHPVFGSTTQRPVVNLPGSKVRYLEDPEDVVSQRPIVRLPPPPKGFNVFGATAAAATVEPRPTSLSPKRAQPFIANPTWQDRINGLFDRKATAAAPLEKKVLDLATDFSISKPSLDLSSVEPTSVTLPPTAKSQSFLTLRDKIVEEEDALFEERDFGSVPTVKIPAMTPHGAWNPAKPYANVKRMKMMALADPYIYSGFNYIPGFEDLARQGEIPIVVRLSGMRTPKTKTLARNSNFKLPRQPYSNVRGKPRNGQKARDQPSPLSSTSPGQLNTGRQSGRQSGGQRKSNSSTHQSWAGRVSGVMQ